MADLGFGIFFGVWLGGAFTITLSITFAIGVAAPLAITLSRRPFLDSNTFAFFVSRC